MGKVAIDRESKEQSARRQKRHARRQLDVQWIHTFGIFDMYIELLSKTVEWKEVMKSYAITLSLSKAESDVKWRRQKTQDDTNAKDH